MLLKGQLFLSCVFFFFPFLSDKEREMVRQKWKGLKSEYLNKVKEVEELLPQLIEKIELLQEKKNQLEASLQRYQDQVRTKKKLVMLAGYICI